MITKLISYDIPHHMKILTLVIHILILFCRFVSIGSITSSIKPHILQRNVADIKLFLTGHNVSNVIQTDFVLQNQVHKNMVF